MNSALLALFTRALREDVRSKSMYWARAGLVGIVLLNLGTTHLSMGWAGAPGLVFFDSIVFINLFFISLAGLSYFSSAITEEKEDMTLGLLRMTNLNPLSILLGKSASRQIGALLLLVSQVPFTLLAVALGGVTLAQIVAAYSCLAAYTLFLGNAALFFSVMMRRSILAAILTGFVLFIFLFGALIIRYPVLASLKFFQMIESENPGPALDAFLTWWLQASPYMRLKEIGITGFHDGPLCFQVVTNILLGVLFFLGAWAVFDVFCNEQPDAAPTRGLLFKSGKRIRIFSPGRARAGALRWKDFHFLGGGHAGVFGKFIAYGGLLGSVAWSQDKFSSRGVNWVDMGYIAMWTMFLAFTFELAFIAARVFRQERMWKTWSSLAMLPMSTQRIAYQKILGCLIATWPAVLFFAIGAGFVVDDWSKTIGQMFFNANRAGSSFEWVAISGFLFGILQTIFFYHLVADLSLRLKWGALPLSLAILWVGTSMMVGMAFLMFKEAAFFVLDFAVGILIVVLHCNIGHRLEHLAAED